MLEKNNIQMIEEIKDVIIRSRNKIAYEVNNTMLLAQFKALSMKDSISTLGFILSFCIT